MRTLSLILLAAAVVYGYFEVRRWQSPEIAGLLSRSQKTRRALMFVCLIAVLGMAFGGTFLPSAHLTRHLALIELMYWLGCFALAAMVGFIAIFEYRRSLREVHQRKHAAARTEAYEALVETVVEAQENAAKAEQLPHRNGFG